MHPIRRANGFPTWTTEFQLPLPLPYHFGNRFDFWTNSFFLKFQKVGAASCNKRVKRGKLKNLLWLQACSNSISAVGDFGFDVQNLWKGFWQDFNRIWEFAVNTSAEPEGLVIMNCSSSPTIEKYVGNRSSKPGERIWKWRKIIFMLHSTRTCQSNSEQSSNGFEFLGHLWIWIS